MNNLQNNLKDLKDEVLFILKERNKQLDEYDINLLLYIINYLESILLEYKMNNFTSKEKRYSHIARILIDRDTSLINSDLSKRLIESEKKYMEHQ